MSAPGPEDSQRRFVGSIVGLRPEYAERYRILHEHVFPTVLERLSRSNIRNYSIYLLDGILFSYLEHVGHDLRADMEAIGADPATQQWWKLTDPMQEPLPGRVEGEWWATLAACEVQDAPEQRPDRARRVAFCAANPATRGARSAARAGSERPPGFSKIRAFPSQDRCYVYAEVSSEVDDREAAAALAPLVGVDEPLRVMAEVFHTDGLEAAEPRARKVFVSGCFDLLHSGHVAFLQEAAGLGDLYVGIGSDATILELKGRPTVNSQAERQFMIEALACVRECRVNTGRGLIDFEREIRDIAPDLLVVNEDGHLPEKEALCRSLGIEYRVLKRVPHAGLPARSTTALRGMSRIPYRIDLAGGWLDQPFVSRFHPGPVLTISIEPTIEFNDRSGMASSTRRKAVELWGSALPHGEPEALAKVLFAVENPPGTREVAGSQDALGIVLPGLNYLYYTGGYWPSRIQSVQDEEILRWLEDRLALVLLGPRSGDYTVIDDTHIDAAGARALADAADASWRAILEKNARALGEAVRRSFEAQAAMFPRMVDGHIRDVIARYAGGALGWKLSGAGGGGYLILVVEEAIADAFRVTIRRRGD